jgi:hypothetical protein
MWDRLYHVWLPRTCFLAALTAALVLVALVIVAPCLATDAPLVALFAKNRGVRGAAIASAAGLLVTAWVFFRASTAPTEKRSPREPPPGTMAGA